MRTRKSDPAVVAGRRNKAEQFEATAEALEGDEHAGDAYVTNCVHAGIAAADVICCVHLGEHYYGEDHNVAASMLARVERDGTGLAKHLRVLLGMKSKAGYGTTLVGRIDRVRAGRAMSALMRAMRES